MAMSPAKVFIFAPADQTGETTSDSKVRGAC